MDQRMAQRRADVMTPLPGQFTISRQGEPGVPEEFDRATVGTWTVTYDAGFSAYPVVAGDEEVGLVIGRVLDVENGGKPRAIHLPGDGPLPPSCAIDRILAKLSGRFVGLVEGADGPHLFTDPVGALPVVYDDEGAFAAASPLSIPSVSHGSHFREDLFEAVGSDGSTWLPGTVTYYHGVSQLLPNHALALDSWEPVRVWPDDDRERDRGTGPGVEATIDRMVVELERVVESAMNHYRRPTMGITAGKDSRCLLAVAREFATGGNLPLYTYEDDRYDVDLHVARRIAETNDLEWTPVPVVESTSSQRERFLERTGYTVSTAAKDVFPTIRSLDTDARIVGQGGEIGRGYYWRISDDERTQLDAESLLDRFHRPAHPVLLDEIGSWLREIQPAEPSTILDLAYQEHRLGCWGGPQYLGINEERDLVAPFCYRPVIELMHRIPTDVRRLDLLPERIIDRTWSDLNGYPYNAYSGPKRWRNLTEWLSRAQAGVANPRSALEYVARRRLG